MLNVLIIDDEKWICELIEQSINWEAMGMQIIGQAGNGIEALDQIMKADIALTDIRMPGMDGIAMIRAARKKGWTGECIIVSGYQDFEYAQRAMEYGVSQYILKPIDEDEIKISLEKLVYKINIQNKEKNMQRETSTKLTKVTEMLRVESVKSIVKTGEKPKNADLGFTNKYYQCLVIWPDYSSWTGNRDEIPKTILNRLLSYIDTSIWNSQSTVSYIEDNSLIIIDNEDIEGDMMRKLQVSILDLKYVANNYPISALTVGVGKPYDHICEIKSSYDEAMMAVKYRMFVGKGRIINYAEYEARRSKCLFTLKQKRLLVNMMQLENTDGIHIWIKDIFNEMRPEIISPKMLEQSVRELIQTFYNTIKDLGIEVEGGALDEAINEYKRISTIEEFKNWLTKKLVWEYHEYIEQRKNSEVRPIALVREYIEKNYSEDVSLTDAAKMVHMNPNYLSTLFKKVMGKSFVNYLTEYRIEIAKTLLRNENFKINDIARKVGYSNPGYFTKTFKKLVGISPQDFKKLSV